MEESENLQEKQSAAILGTFTGPGLSDEAAWSKGKVSIAQQREGLRWLGGGQSEGVGVGWPSGRRPI